MFSVNPLIFLCVLRVSVLKNLFAVEPISNLQEAYTTRGARYSPKTRRRTSLISPRVA